MTLTPKLITYAATEGDTCVILRYAARFQLPNGELHPVIFHGEDLPVLRERAAAWWLKQIELAKQKAGLTEERIIALRAARAKAKAAKAAKAAQS